ALSWTEPAPTTSLELIAEAAIPLDAAIIDVGGGASMLAGELLLAGYADVTVADISAAALARARSELGEAGGRVRWIETDVRRADFGRAFALWHDRAVFHFMVSEEDRRAYLRTLGRSLAPGGHLVLATFGPEGPSECSGLPVRRYDAAAIAGLLGEEYELVSARLHEHRTPRGAAQQFVYAHLERRGRG
ncbi:MAG: class I SAM-dependent methyltransferase, partial [Syntrophothermus sp.]